MNWWLQNVSEWRNHDHIDAMLHLQHLMEGLAVKDVMNAAVGRAPRMIARAFCSEWQ